MATDEGLMRDEIIDRSIETAIFRRLLYRGGWRRQRKRYLDVHFGFLCVRRKSNGCKHVHNSARILRGRICKISKVELYLLQHGEGYYNTKDEKLSIFSAVTTCYSFGSILKHKASILTVLSSFLSKTFLCRVISKKVRIHLFSKIRSKNSNVSK